MRLVHHLRPPCDLEEDEDGIWGHVPPVDAHLASAGVYDLDPIDAALFPPAARANLIIPGESRGPLKVKPYYRRLLASGMVRLWLRADEPRASPPQFPPPPAQAHDANGSGVDVAGHNSYSGKQRRKRSLGAERRGSAKKYPTQTQGHNRLTHNDSHN